MLLEKADVVRTGLFIEQVRTGQLTFGQIICNDMNLQGGSSSSSEQIFFGGPSLPSPLFDVRLIE